MTRFRARIRVRYPEVDGMGVVHHSHIPVWFEVGRTEVMRELGLPYADLEAGGVFMPVAAMGATYITPIRYDEQVDVVTSVEDVRGARVRFGYRLLRVPGGELLATGFTVHAAVDAGGRVLRMPANLRAALASVREGEGADS